MRILLIFFLTFGKFAFADINAANKFTHDLYKDLVGTTKVLNDLTIQNCFAPIVKLAYQNSFDAWIAASVIQFGPIQELGGQISFSFWPTLLIGVALGMTISLLLIHNIKSLEQLFIVIVFSIAGLIILGVITRLISIFYWKKYNWSFSSDLK